MQAGSRRRLDVVLLGAGVIAAAAVAAVGGVIGDAERVTGMWVGAELDGDGSAEVLEVIDYDFGLAAEKHGIFRTIPGLPPQAPVSVRSDSAPDDIAAKTPDVIGGEDGVRLKIGDPGITINGRHRYVIGYELPAGVLTPQPDELAWDAVGTGWEVEVAQGEIHVVAPWELEDVRCTQGATGSTDECDVEEVEPGHVVAQVGSLDSGKGATIYAALGDSLPGGAPELPAPPTSAPPDPGAGLLLPAGTAGLAAAVAAAATSRVVRQRGRERVGGGAAADAAYAAPGEPAGEVLLDQEELAEMATTEFAPPEGMRAPMGGIVLAETVQSEHKVAWLIEAAIEGAVELTEEGGDRVRLVRTGQGSGDTEAILDIAFAGRPEVDLGKYDPSFAKAWDRLGESLEAWRRQSGLWDVAGDRRRAAVRALGLLVAVVSAVGVGAGGAFASRWGEPWLVLAAVAAVLFGGGLAAAIRGWELRVRTPKGSGLWLRVESFRRFLAGSEAFHAEEAAKRGVLREYTAWAVAVGEIDRWERAVSTSGAIPAAAGLGYVYLAPVLISATSASSTAPSSSGGGGGGVGGGGGGGGGGSW